MGVIRVGFVSIHTLVSKLHDQYKKVMCNFIYELIILHSPKRSKTDFSREAILG